jgi:hypothetical protein
MLIYINRYFWHADLSGRALLHQRQRLVQRVPRRRAQPVQELDLVRQHRLRLHRHLSDSHAGELDHDNVPCAGRPHRVRLGLLRARHCDRLLLLAQHGARGHFGAVLGDEGARRKADGQGEAGRAAGEVNYSS